MKQIMKIMIGIMLLLVLISANTMAFDLAGVVNTDENIEIEECDTEYGEAGCALIEVPFRIAIADEADASDIEIAINAKKMIEYRESIKLGSIKLFGYMNAFELDEQVTLAIYQGKAVIVVGDHSSVEQVKFSIRSQDALKDLDVEYKTVLSGEIKSSDLRELFEPDPDPTPLPNPVGDVKIDAVFLIDSTGSMADEIRSVKSHIIKIVDEVRSGQPSPDLKIGVVTYRDYEPEEREYLVKSFDLTDDVDDALNFIKKIQANGGGDYPEAVATGMHHAVNKMEYRSDAIKVVFLIGDASPHGVGSAETTFVQGNPDGFDYKELINDAKDQGIIFYTVSGSGMDPVGLNVWKEIADKTGGQYERLTYERQDVDEYYASESIEEDWVIEEAKASADYEASSNSIVTNTLGIFASSMLKAEAMEAGVRYDDGPTGDVVVDPVDPSGDDVEEENAFYQFLKNVFEKLKFW